MIPAREAAKGNEEIKHHNSLLLHDNYYIQYIYTENVCAYRIKETN